MKKNSIHALMSILLLTGALLNNRIGFATKGVGNGFIDYTQSSAPTCDTNHPETCSRVSANNNSGTENDNSSSLPEGNYQGSCNGCTLGGDTATLTCTSCTKADGSSSQTSIAIDPNNANLNNCDGVLTYGDC